MHSAKSTTLWFKRYGWVLLICLFFSATAQDNSPYSRYGIGDIVPNRNIISRSMGGVGVAFAVDTSLPYIPVGMLNISNPASLGSLSSNSYINTLFDVGVEVDKHTLKSNTTPGKYTSNNINISYVQLGFPVASKKMELKGMQWGLSFGLRPLTRINYKVEDNKRLTNIDSVNLLYEGNGGISQANVSTGIRIKNFSFGLSTGYSFGSKDYSTRQTFINDTIAYYRNHSSRNTRIGGVFLNLGAQYQIKTKNGLLQLGATAALQQNLTGTADELDETFTYNSYDEPVSIDTVNYKNNNKGTVKLPATYSLGFLYRNTHWLWGADFDYTAWDSYSFYGTKDPAVKNNWTLRVGAQYYAADKFTPINKYWRFVKYRTGAYFGPDYINIGKKRNEYGFSVGAGFPLTSFQRLRLGGEYVTLNTSLEVGVRGDKNSASFRENFARFSFGISMGQRWFQKRKYD
ncbi:MAG: hypothetical protein J0H76_00750 [Sphingobacteriales bacterium]|nr:hypothetical protein [Sphingobacteriales bacterium]